MEKKLEIDSLEVLALFSDGTIRQIFIDKNSKLAIISLLSNNDTPIKINENPLQGITIEVKEGNKLGIKVREE